MSIYDKIFLGGKKFFLLIDPDKHNVQSLIATVYAADEARTDLILVGGSIVSDRIDSTIEVIKKHTDIPVLLFPGSLMQLSNKADGILLLSLISGRNPEYLIGNHVLAAPYLKKSNMEVIATAYILVGERNNSSVEYISNTKPIPSDKTDLVVATALAGEMMGNKLIYLEAGSGAVESIPHKLISAVKSNVNVPLIVGGGLRDTTAISGALNAGADIIVVGNAIEDNIHALSKLVKGSRF